MLALLDQFQTAIVGIIGFAGVILTLRHTAELAKRERIERLEQDRESVRVALITELGIVLLALQDNIKRVVETIEHNEERADGEKTSVLIPPEPLSDSYNVLLPKIGLLSHGQTQPVMYAYLTVKSAWQKLPLWAKFDEKSGHFYVGGRDLTVLRGIWENLMPGIEGAILALKKKPDE